MPETTPLIKAALNLRVGAGFDVYIFCAFALFYVAIIEDMQKGYLHHVL